MSSLESLFKQLNPIRVIDASIPLSHYIPIDFSASNKELSKIAINNPSVVEEYITNFVTKNNGKVAFGGYNEHRNLYQSSLLFNKSSLAERNIHLGIDFWTNAETSVLAALNGKIHSYKNNDKLGDYGPTIILEHLIENHTFYTLYGHLSEESIQNSKIGTFINQGETIASLGDNTINGGYAPHLHFQIIKDIGDCIGDYPGVCNHKDLDFYLQNCPDPNLLLKI
jgi:murein DD-endopeptidase MepM/ murein hydrolase activator NlpD